MPGVDSTHLVTGGDEIAEALHVYLDYVEAVTKEAVARHQESLLDRFHDSAHRQPRWAEIAGDLDQWEDEDGNVVVGVSPASEAYEAAVRAEYGDAEHPPVPLLRMGMLSHAVDIGHSLDEEFRGRGL